jgi:hypothetical protein
VCDRGSRATTLRNVPALGPPVSPQSASEWLGEWLAEEFGVRDERLVNDPELADAVASAHENLQRRITETAVDREDHRETYRGAVEQAAERNEESEENKENEEDRLRELAQEAKMAKKRYRLYSRQLARLRLRLTAVLVVDARRTFDGVPEPDPELSEALFDRFLAAQRDISGFERSEFNSRTDTVREALDFEVRLYPTIEEPETTGVPGEHTGHLPGEERPDDGLEEEELELADESTLDTPPDDIELSGDIDISDVDGL